MTMKDSTTQIKVEILSVLNSKEVVAEGEMFFSRHGVDESSRLGKLKKSRLLTMFGSHLLLRESQKDNEFDEYFNVTHSHFERLVELAERILAAETEEEARKEDLDWQRVVNEVGEDQES